MDKQNKTFVENHCFVFSVPAKYLQNTHIGLEPDVYSKITKYLTVNAKLNGQFSVVV